MGTIVIVIVIIIIIIIIIIALDHIAPLSEFDSEKFDPAIWGVASVQLARSQANSSQGPPAVGLASWNKR